MLGYFEAQQAILERVRSRPVVQLPLLAARNLILAEDAHAPFPLPRFDHSAVDGYALRAADTLHASTESPAKLQVLSAVRTGSVADKEVTAGAVIQVFTGAMLPAGADTVVMVEDVERRGSEILIAAHAAPDKNIRRTGEEFSAGATCLRAGQQLTPPALSLLASLGMGHVPVHDAPRIALLITGSELIEPGLPLGPAQIYNSNRYGLESALDDMGLTVTALHVAEDHESELQKQLGEAMKRADVVLTSGGVSVGDVDFVKPALLSLGAVIHFDKVAIKPGKPFVFATLGDKFIFGMPGNPVSALVTFLLFVKPALAKMLGRAEHLPRITHASLGCDIKKRSPRTEFVRGQFRTLEPTRIVEPCRGQESHMLGGLATADVLIILDGEPRIVREGDQVQVMPINWT